MRLIQKQLRLLYPDQATEIGLLPYSKQTCVSGKPVFDYGGPYYLFCGYCHRLLIRRDISSPPDFHDDTAVQCPSCEWHNLVPSEVRSAC